jgi:hypothetical protein
MAFGMHLTRCIPAVFWQTGHNNDPVSTRTETDGFTGFYGINRGVRKGNGAQSGLISLKVHTLLFQASPVSEHFKWRDHISLLSL